jgi:hypothetical protein
VQRLLVLVVVLLTTPALAKPKIAVTPVSGSGGKEVEKIIVDALASTGTVIKPKDTGKAMEKLELTGELDDTGARRLQKKLDAAVVVQGRIKKSGGTNSLRLTIAVRDKEPKGFTLEYKNAKSEKFRETIESELTKRIAAAREDDDDDGKKKKRKPEVAERGDDDDNKVRKKKKRKRRGDDDSDDDLRVRAKAAGRTMLRLDLGGGFGIRRLTYTADTPPPRLGTASASAHIEGELYPFAGDPKSAGAGLGIAAEYDKTFGLAIAIPGMNVNAPIDKQYLSLGARYRFGVGEMSTIVLGLDFVKSKYIADRSGLMAPGDLDAPDVDYTAVAPGLGFRAPVAPKAALFGTGRALLIFNTGPIQKNDSFGAATVYGAGLDAGLDIALGGSVGLRFAGEFQQINYKFKGNGARAIAGGVTAAPDRED